MLAAQQQLAAATARTTASRAASDSGKANSEQQLREAQQRLVAAAAAAAAADAERELEQASASESAEEVVLLRAELGRLREAAAVLTAKCANSTRDVIDAHAGRTYAEAHIAHLERHIQSSSAQQKVGVVWVMTLVNT